MEGAQCQLLNFWRRGNLCTPPPLSFLANDAIKIRNLIRESVPEVLMIDRAFVHTNCKKINKK